MNKINKALPLFVALVFVITIVAVTVSPEMRRRFFNVWPFFGLFFGLSFVFLKERISWPKKKSISTNCGAIIFLGMVAITLTGETIGFVWVSKEKALDRQQIAESHFACIYAEGDGRLCH